MKTRLRHLAILIAALLLLCICGTQGMALPARLQPDGDIVYTTNQHYSYEQMMADIEDLAAAYPDMLRSRIIGKSAYGRDIVMMTIGNPNAKLTLMVDASVHAREYITTLLAMKQAEDILYRATHDADIAALLEQVRIICIPMLNPDGVMLAQQGLDSAPNDKMRNQLLDWNDGSDDFSQWKANGRGVDLNRNMNIEWIPGTAESSPAPANYPGQYALSEPESIAIYEVMRQLRPDMLLNYHSTGSIIFWYGGETGARLERVRQQAHTIADVTGYTLMQTEVSKTKGSIKLWFNVALGKPAFTVEVGHSSAPVPIDEFPRIWDDNKDMLPTVMRMLIEEQTDTQRKIDTLQNELQDVLYE